MLGWLCALEFVACGHVTLNQRLDPTTQSKSVRCLQVPPDARCQTPRGALVGFAVSGGGSRAARYTAAVFEQLDQVSVKRADADGDALKSLVTQLQGAADLSDAETSVRGNLDSLTLPQGAEGEELRNGLSLAGFKVVQTFFVKDTQAFLAARESDQTAVLAFRGTEMKLADWKSDFEVDLTVVPGGRVHDGFWQAYCCVHGLVVDAVGPLVTNEYQLYVTGHSLGGALAVLATRQLDLDARVNSDHLAACYTFGGQRVSDISLGASSRPPIYRIVNNADIVPHLPTSFWLEAISYVLNGLSGSDVLSATVKATPLAGIVELVRRVLPQAFQKFGGYRHFGDVRCINDGDDKEKVEVISDPPLFDTLRWWSSRVVANWKSELVDHGIDQYSARLRAYAERRFAVVRRGRGSRTPSDWCPGTVRGESAACNVPAQAETGATVEEHKIHHA